MNIHSLARTCPSSRALLVERVQRQKWTAAQAAAALGVSERTGYKWLARYRSDGADGLRDRSSRPHSVPGSCQPTGKPSSSSSAAAA
jgi:hypothetical protein